MYKRALRSVCTSKILLLLIFVESSTGFGHRDMSQRGLVPVYSWSSLIQKVPLTGGGFRGWVTQLLAAKRFSALAANLQPLNKIRSLNLPCIASDLRTASVGGGSAESTALSALTCCDCPLLHRAVKLTNTDSTAISSENSKHLFKRRPSSISLFFYLRRNYGEP